MDKDENKKPERTEKTKTAIFNAFWSIYGKKPISKITVSDVTRIAGVHRSTFYLYFTDIYDLLSKAEEDLLNECNSLSVNIDGKHIDSTLIMDSLVEFYKSHLSKLSSLLGQNGDPGFHYALKSHMIPPILKQFGISEDDKEMAILFDYFLTAMLSLLTYTYFNPIDDEPISISLQRIHIILSIGITPLIKAHTNSAKVLEFFERRNEETRQYLDKYPQEDKAT